MYIYFNWPRQVLLQACRYFTYSTAERDGLRYQHQPRRYPKQSKLIQKGRGFTDQGLAQGGEWRQSRERMQKAMLNKGLQREEHGDRKKSGRWGDIYHCNKSNGSPKSCKS